MSPVVRTCSVTRYHRPRPVQIDHHHVWPIAEGGPNVAANRVDACPSCHTSIHALLREYDRLRYTPPWLTRRKYPRGVQRLAALGWDRIGRQAL